MTWTTRPRSRTSPLAAVTAGSGPLVLLIHGVGLRAEAWGAQIDALAKTCRVVAVDMPGHGHSTALKSSPELADFANAMVASLDGPAVVIGHSFGAMIALDMAIHHPQHVLGVAALNAIHQRSPDAKAAIVARAARLDALNVADPSATLDRWFGTAASPERDACCEWLSTVDPAGYRDAYRVFAREDGPSCQGLSTLGCPALFMTGENEPNSTPTMSRNMAALVTGATSEIVADAAHMLPMTHAAQVSLSLANFVEAIVQ
jgi:pimeloyl-ACP methyl ester carboxylesterase